MKKVVALLLVLILVLGVAACGKKSEDPVPQTPETPDAVDTSDNGFVIQPKNGDKYVVGVVVKTVESAFYQRMATAVVDAYKDSDLFDVIVQASETEMDTTGFIQIIEDMITKDVDCLIVVPGDPDAVRPTLESVVKAGIPVICSETDVPDLDGKLTYVGIDNVLAGKSVVDHMFESGLVKEGDKCAVITGPVGYTTSTDRGQGAKDGITANGGELVAEQPADWERTKGMEVAENILTANPDLKYFACSNGEMALGAAEAIASANKVGEVYVTGFDGILDEYYAIEDGILAATVLQDSTQYSLLAMELFIEYLKGNELEEFYDIGSPLVTPDNVADYIATSSEN